MAQNDPITALEYNNVFNLLNPIVGKSPNGYGRTLLSSTVIGGSTIGVSDTVTSQQQLDLFIDLQAAYVHQTGTVSNNISITDFDPDTSVEFSDISDLGTISSLVANFNPTFSQDFPVGNFLQQVLKTSGGADVTSTRSTSWGTSTEPRINHRITVTWPSADDRNYFFNSGGQIRFEANLTGGTSGTTDTKDWDWQRILNNMGQIQFGKRFSDNAWRTISTGTGTGSEFLSLSNDTTVSGGLLANATKIFSQFGGGTAGGNTGTVDPTLIYSDNEYYIQAVEPNSTSLIFEIVFDDGDTGTGGQQEGVNDPVDEPVTGTITSFVRTFTADSEFTINTVTYPAVIFSPPLGTINSQL